jgi:hypothetical protein
LLIGLKDHTIAGYMEIYKPSGLKNLLVGKQPGAVLKAIQADYGIGVGKVRVLDQTVWAEEYEKTYGKKIDISGKLGGTTLDAQGNPMLFISSALIDRCLKAGSIGEIVSTMRHEYQHAQQITAKQMIYNNVDLREFEAHYIELLHYAGARSELARVKLRWSQQLAEHNPNGWLTKSQHAAIGAFGSALAVNDDSLTTALRTAMQHYDNMPVDYQKAHAHAKFLLDGVYHRAFRRDPEDQLSVADAIAYTIDDADIVDFMQTCRNLRAHGLTM